MGKLNKDTAAYSNKLQYINEYNKEKYENLSIRIPKGLKAIYKEYAKEHGLSLSGLICTAVNDYMGKYTAQNSPEQAKKE